MTEEEWLACGDPAPMLESLRGKASDRKLRLFAAACCRRVWHLLADESREAVEVAERFADGGATGRELRAAGADAWNSTLRVVRGDEDFADLGDDAPNAADAPAWTADEVVDPLRVIVAARRALGTAEGKSQADRARCVFANPFRAVTFDPSWHTPTVNSLAQAAYDGRILPSGELDPLRLAVLADALEEAGAGGELVGHLRSAGPHVRGCWAVDLVLGKV